MVGSNKTTANVTDKLISSTQDVILATLKTINDCLDKIEKGGGGRRRRGRERGGTGKDANTQAAHEECKPCVNCDKHHKLPDKKCWTLDANKDDRLPTKYVKPPPGFNKGNCWGGAVAEIRVLSINHVRAYQQ